MAKTGGLQPGYNNLKKIKRIITWTIWSLLALYLAFHVLLQVPAVQRTIGRQVGQALAHKLGTEVSVGRIELSFPNRVIIDNVLVNDQQHRPMLRVARLSAKAELLALAQGRIVITSAQLFGLNASLSQQDEASKPNFQFVIDSLASRDTTVHTPLDLRIGSLVVRRASVSFDRHDLPPTHQRFNPHHLHLSNLSAHLMLNALTDSTVDLTVKKLSGAEQSGLQLRHLSFRFQGSPTRASLRNLIVKLPNTDIRSDSLSATYTTVNNQIVKPSIRFSGNLANSYVTPADVKALVPQLASFTSLLHFNSSFTGTSTTMSVGRLQMYSQPEGLELDLNGSVSNPDHPRWHVNIANLSMSAKTIDFLSRNMNIREVKVPDVLVRFGDVSYQGEAGGVGDAVSTKGILRSGVGNAAVGIGLRGDEFTGRIETERLDLGRLLASSDFGQIATHISIDGNLGALRSHPGQSIAVNGQVSQLDYKSYTYHDIHIDGRYSDNTLEGTLNINDPNGTIALDGLLKTDARQPLCRLNAKVHNLNMGATHLTDKWEGHTLSATLEADLTGSSLNTIGGHLSIAEMTVASPGQSYHLDHLTLTADNSGGEQLLHLQSDFADATLRGSIDYASLVESLTDQIGRFLPTMPGLPPSSHRPHRNKLTFSATVSKSDWLRQLLGIDVWLHEPLYLYARMDNAAGDLHVQSTIPDITYGGSRYRDTHIAVSSPGDTLHADVSTDRLSDDGTPFHWQVSTRAANNRLSALIGFNNNNALKPFSGTINAAANFFRDEHHRPATHVNVYRSDMIVGDTVWTVQPSDIVYSDNHLVVDHFAVVHNNQHLIVSGRATKNLNDTLLIDLKDVDVNYITNLVNFHSVEFGGLATGRAVIASAFHNPRAHADLSVAQFTFQDGRLGTLRAKVDYDNDDKQILIRAVADDGPDRYVNVDGYVSPAHNHIDLAISPHQARLEFLESFCASFMRNVDAYTTGRLRLYGPLNDINLTGLAVANGQLDIKPLNTTYWLRNDTIRLIPDEIVFQADTIYDRDGHRGVVSGALHHQSLKHLTYDIDVSADHLLAYDFDDYGDDTFYGTVWATGNCAIHGRSGRIVMDVNVRPEQGSFIEYNASAPDALSNQDFILWNDVGQEVSAAPAPVGAIDSQNGDGRSEPADNDAASDMHINFIIDCTPDATLRLLMDKHSGDYIALNGTGAIRATYFNKGSFDMFGTYLVDHGIYKLTIQNIIKKDFQFQPGGTIVFGGNPYDAVLDLKALYTVNGVPLSDLNIGRSFSNNNVRVDCIMNITGNPNEPKVDFDLDLPTVNADAKQMVRSIINGQEEMNQQVIYLLGIGRFYTLEANNSAEEPGQQSQTSLAMQSLLSGTISQQINNVLSSVVNNSNWNFGANISTGDEGWNNAEYEGMLSGRLLNNRLLINGQFGYRDNPNATTSFIGDFDIRYLLTPGGNLSVKMYNQTNDRYFTRNSLNTQGVGLLMKKDFNSLSDLFGRSRRKSGAGNVKKQ